jgi:hypothetical protein
MNQENRGGYIHETSAIPKGANGFVWSKCAAANKDKPRRVSIALAVIAMLAIGYSPRAHAQLAVSDAPVEAGIADLQTVQVPGILKQTAASALSLTTPGGAGIWTRQSVYLGHLMDALASGGVVDPQTFASIYPGWFSPGPAAIYAAENVVTKTLNTYAAALTVVKSQATDFATEDTSLGAVEACNSRAAAVLQAIQCNTEAQLAIAQQIQLERQLMMTLIATTAVGNGEQLNGIAQQQAANAVYYNFGQMP